MKERDLFDAMELADAKQIAAALGEAAEPAEAVPAEKPVPVKPDKGMSPVWRWILTAGCAAACIGSAVMLVHLIPKNDYTYTQHSAEDIEVTRDSLHTETTAAVQNAGTDAQPEQTETEMPKKRTETVTEPAAEQTAVTTSAGEKPQTAPAKTTASKQQAAEVPVSRTEPAKTEPVTQQTEELPETTSQPETVNLIQVTKPTREELIEKYGYLLQEEKGTTKTWYSEAHGDASFMPKTGEVVRSGKADGFRFEILDTGKARINGLDDAEIDTKAETLIIPNTIDGCTVTEIGYRAFENCYKNMPAIKEIYIPDSVEIIAEGAFAEAFCDSRHIGPGDVGPDGAAPEGAKINIPNNVVFIGFEAFNFDLFAISNAQNGDRIIHLPESLEYISYTAFGWIDRRYKGGFEIDMPKSLVFMSDYCFDAYAVHGNIRTQQVQQVIMDADSFHKEDLPLLMNEMNQSFYQGERNIVTMGDIFGAKVKVLEEYSKLWYNQAVNDSSAMFVHACKLAAQYAPDLLPENVKAAMEQ